MSEPTAGLSSEGETVIDEGLVVNGPIDLRKTHPTLYRSITTYALVDVALGICFWIFVPTFPVYGMPNPLWGTIYLAIGLSGLVFLNLYRRLRLVRITMAFSIGYALFFGVGTLEPVFMGKASPQLIILYAGMSALQFQLLIEPFINPWTARRT